MKKMIAIISLVTISFTVFGVAHAAELNTSSNEELQAELGRRLSKGVYQSFKAACAPLDSTGETVQKVKLIISSVNLQNMKEDAILSALLDPKKGRGCNSADMSNELYYNSMCANSLVAACSKMETFLNKQFSSMTENSKFYILLDDRRPYSTKEDKSLLYLISRTEPTVIEQAKSLSEDIFKTYRNSPSVDVDESYNMLITSGYAHKSNNDYENGTLYFSVVTK